MSVLTGKRALVTGGSKGFGRMLSLELAKRGVEVLTVARSEDRLASLKQEVEAAGGRLAYMKADLTDPESIDGVIKWVHETGGAEILVHNAGRLPTNAPLDATFGDFQLTYTLNTVAPLYATAQWIKGYDGSGRRPEQVLFVASISGLISWEDVNPGYTGSKTALMAGIQNLRLDVADRHAKGGLGNLVTFKAVYPHTFETDMVKGTNWTRMDADVVRDAVVGMLGNEAPYADRSEVVLHIRGDGVYAGFMPYGELSSRPDVDRANWTKIAGNDRVTRP